MRTRQLCATHAGQPAGGFAHVKVFSLSGSPARVHDLFDSYLTLERFSNRILAELTLVRDDASTGRFFSSASMITSGD